MGVTFTKIDKEIYEYISKKRNVEFNVLINELKIDSDSIRRSIEFLKSEDIIVESIIKKDIFELSELGEEALNGNLLEDVFCKAMINKDVYVSDLRNITIHPLSSEEISLAFGIAKRNNLISVDNGIIRLVPDYKEIIKKTTDALQEIKSNPLAKINNDYLSEFTRRKLVIKKQTIQKNYSFQKEVEYKINDNSILELTPAMIKSKSYSDIKFKEYEVSVLPTPRESGRYHPLREIINTIKQVYMEMGFLEMRGPYVETAFWAMDAMFISQDHPMRDVQDTFYLPISGQLSDKRLSKRISEMHRTGAKTGSLGHRYVWKEDVAAQLILRPHTTAVTYRTFNTLEKKNEAKYFCVGKVFRNETSNSSHLPEFHQAEGFVIGKDIGLAELMGFITEFASRLGLHKIKFKPTYNPYTEPSVEAFAYYEKEKRWMEFINAGVFRREALEPYKIKNNVIAWGLGVERVAMLLYQKSIKEIYGDECNLDWLRTYKITNNKF